jgi:protease I
MKALIITSQLVQDHEFIYPFYRLKEEGLEVDVYNQTNQLLKVFLERKYPHKKMTKLFLLDSININQYDLLVLPGGVKSMELLRLDKKAIDTIKNLMKKKS